MKKKLGVFLILGAFCAALLAGCNIDTAIVNSTVEFPLDSSVTEESSATDEKNPTVQLEKYYENTTGDSSALLMRITGDSNPAINAINAEIADIQADYEEAVRNLDDYSWVEYTAIPSDNARFLNIVVHDIQYPTYGYHGEIETFIYDIENQKQISNDTVLNQLNLSEDTLEQSFVTYYNGLNETNQYRILDDFEVEGTILYEDGSAAIFIKVETKDGPNMPMEYSTSSNSELYIYQSADRSFSTFEFTNF